MRSCNISNPFHSPLNLEGASEMSNVTKGTVVRLLLPKDSVGKILSVLGPTSKVESRDTLLTAGKLTTDEIVKHIKEYSRLKDDLLHTIRLLAVPREPRSSNPEPGNYTIIMSSAQEKLEAYRTRYQEIQRRIETIERALEDSRKQLAKISELAETGFGPADVTSLSGNFARILGRIPARRLEDAQRTLQSNFKDQVIVATGRRVKDWVYILVAIPPDKTSQALQTLLIYDFVQAEIPKSEQPDLHQARTSLEQKMRELGKDLDLAKEEMKRFQAEAGEELNGLTDSARDLVMLLQGILKMGEGANAVQTLALFAKSPNPKTLNAVQSMGALVETE